jgi:hypothetical protein
MSLCTAYFRGEDIYVVASAKNTFGIYNSTEPVFRLTQPVTAEVLGEKILETLRAYRENVPGRYYVRGEKNPPDPVLKALGFRSWRALERGASSFSIESDTTRVEIVPSVPAPKGGFLHQPDQKVRCAPVAGEIGRALLRLFSTTVSPD